MDLIVIPSMGRAKRQQTLATFARTNILDIYNVVVAVPDEEVDSYTTPSYKGKRIRGNFKIAAVPNEFAGITLTRKYILTTLARAHKARYVFMIDDDLSICHRPRINKPDMPYINNDSYQLVRMIETLTHWLQNGFIHVGLISRQANRKTGIAWQQPGRIMNAYAYDSLAIRNLRRDKQIAFNRVPVMEDFDLTLQLLKLGYPNRVSCRYAWTQTSNSDGGCSSYRSAEVQAAAARKMVRLHAPFVTLVEKKVAKTWQNKLVVRTDVRVAWKKALAYGMEHQYETA